MKTALDPEGALALLYLATGSTATGESPAPAKTQAESAGTTRVVPDRLEDLTISAAVWTRALSFEHDRLHGWQRLLGYPVVVITAVTGLAAFTQLDGNPAWWATLTVAIIAGIASVLSAVQTHGDFANRAQAAAASSDAFGSLLGRMLEASEQCAAGTPPTQADLDKLYEEYTTLRKGRPNVRNTLYRDAQDAVREHLALQKDLAAAHTR